MHLLILLLLALLAASPAHAQGISQLQQFTSTTSPSSAITQTTFGKAIKITGLATGNCLTLDSNGILTTTTCGSGGSSTFGTTSISATSPLSWNTLTATLSFLF